MRHAAAALAAAILAVLAVAYYLTYEPAPSVDIQFADSLDDERKMAVARRFRLVNGTNPGGSGSYDLIDTRPSNIRELLQQPEIAATGQIDRDTFTVRPDAPYGRGWMWIGNRLPVLRTPGVVPAIIVACLLVASYPAWRRLVRRNRS